MFKSVKEFAEALLEGKEFTFSKQFRHHDRYGRIFFFKDGFKWRDIDHPIEDEMNQSDFYTYHKVEEYKKPHWHDNIPEQGILCWVKDSPLEKARLGLVFDYNPNRLDPYSTAFSAFKFATPLTLEEVKQFTYQP